MLVRTANRDDPFLKKQSHLGVPFLARLFGQANSVRNF